MERDGLWTVWMRRRDGLGKGKEVEGWIGLEEKEDEEEKEGEEKNG